MKNSSLGASFALMKNFGRLTDSKSSFAPKIFHKYKTSTANTRICDSNQGDSSDSTNRHCEILCKQRGIVAIQNSPSLAEGARGWVICHCGATCRRSNPKQKMWIATTCFRKSRNDNEPRQ